MLIPRYCFSDEFTGFINQIQEISNSKKSVHKNEFLWASGEEFKKMYFIISGIAHTYIEHENGHKKIISFHSNGNIFPGYHSNKFKIENSIVTKAVSDMEVFEFDYKDFGDLLKHNDLLLETVINNYSSYVNLLLYEVAHQKYNNSFMKLCNLLYLFYNSYILSCDGKISITQEEISEILAINRVNLAKNLSKLRCEKIISTSRKSIDILNIDKLIIYCSQETLL